MKAKPILFNAEMVRAILDGRKTQTRRVIKSQPESNQYVDANRFAATGWSILEYGEAFDRVVKNIRCPYGKPGGLLWVRETWATYPLSAKAARLKPSLLPTDSSIHYRANENESHFVWCPSIFMPRWASRITLRVKRVWVERVQDISKKGACAEGVYWSEAFPEGYTAGLPHDYSTKAMDAVLSFQKLWDKINAKRGFGWDMNPWVFAVEFEVKE